MSRFAKSSLLAVAALLLLIVIGEVVLNGTYYGRERVRRLALVAMRVIVKGELIGGRLDGNLLDRFDLVDVAILGDDGQTCLIADRVRARVAFGPFPYRRRV